MQGQTVITIGVYSFDSRYCIGQGSFGRVYKGKNSESQQTVAIKELDRSLVSEQEINREIQILKPLVHPNIVRYEATLKTNDFFYIVTEYCNGGDLGNYFEESCEQEDEDSGDGEPNRKLDKLIDMFFQICEGFIYLRKFNIIHRDLKPTNILLHNGVYKIADFGVSKTEQLHKSLISNELVGVPIYMAPQVLSKNFYSYKCDVWSLGVIVYEFYFKKLPWRANNVTGLFFQIMDNPTPYLDQNAKLPTLLKCIFEYTLQPLEKERMTWEQLLGLRNKRKKIFEDSKLRKTQENAKGYEPQLPPYTDLSASKISKSIPPFESEVLRHIVCQWESLSSELKSLVGEECFSAFMRTTRDYLIRGEEYKQCFADCASFMLRIAGENLHLYTIGLHVLEEARELLVLLELVHDVITMKPNCVRDEFKKIIVAGSCRSQQIDVYAASVISKINTYRLNDVRIF